MKRLSWTLAAALAVGALALIGLGPRPAAAAEATDAKALFTQYKCHSCHSIQSQGIAVLKEEGEEADEDAEPKDLSNVGGDHDVKWITGWLEKKEQIDGKTHRKKFPGDAAQLKAMAAWLATLKK